MAKKHLLSPEQDIAATPQQNVWVQANAGTGKTSVLIQRLLRILFRSPQCTTSGILCLTYTNAGAGEMRNRILAALRNWAMLSDEELRDLLDNVAINKPVTDGDILHARQIFFTYIDNPNILKIKTIHGFCEEILHRFPLEAGLSPAWSLVSGAPQTALLQDAFQNMINHANEQTFNAFVHITKRVSEYYIDDLLNILCGQYKQMFQVDDLIKYRKYFIDTTKEILNIKTQLQPDFDVVHLEKLIFQASELQKSKKTPVKYLDKIITLTKQYINNTINFDEYRYAYLNKDLSKIGNVSKIDFLTTEQNRIFDIVQHEQNTIIFQDTLALFDLSVAFANEYRAIKKSKNLLDFEDLILHTRKLFSDRSNMGWVLSQMDLSLSHILVDEAQDTAPSQWDILRMLSSDFFAEGDTQNTPRSIFVVGDTKQSIYGFQGADPQAFAASRDIITQQIEQNMRAIREIPLTQSFRSTAPILHTVDTFFNHNTIHQISGFVNNNHKCFRQDATGLVEIHKLHSQHEQDVTRHDFICEIADKIKELIDAGKYTASDIMILVQRRGQLALPMVNELKHRNISVAGQDRIILPEFPLIRDMLNLVRWCINTADDYSLCCVLKSPIFCMKELDIFNLCQTKNNTNSLCKNSDQSAVAITIFDTLENTHPDIYKTLSDIHADAQHLSPYSFFTQLLSKYKFRQKFIAALGNQIIDPLEEFLTICLSYERTQPGTLFHFLKWFITGGSEVKRDMDAADGVRIVTVHGSKGLESPVVFLIDTTTTPQSDDITPIENTSMPVWLWSPQKHSVIFEQYKDIQKESKTSEYYRLLYVAMTRARDELYIYGHTTNKNAPEKSWYTQLWQILGNDSSEQFIRITNDNIK